MVLSSFFFRMQVKIDSFATSIKASPPIMKASQKEFSLELVVDADLVSNYLSIRYLCSQSLDSHFDLLNANLFATPSNTFVQHLMIMIFHKEHVLAVSL